jgi:hypothetical protein
LKARAANGPQFVNYSGSATAPVNTVRVTADPGFVAAVTSSAGCTAVTANAEYTCPSLPTASEVIANFTYNPQPADITAALPTGGRVNMTKLNGVYAGQVLISSVKFVFTPKAGYETAAANVTFNGLGVNPDAAHILVTGGNTVNGISYPVTITLLPGYVIPATLQFGCTFAAISGGTPAIVITNNNPTVAAGVSTASLSAVPAGGTWSVIGGPNLPDPLNPGKYIHYTAAITSAGAVSNMTVNGTYFFKYAMSATDYRTTSIIVGSLTTGSCTNCHAVNGVGLAVNASYPTSVHGVSGTSCGQCHAEAADPNIVHPGAVQCATCHTGVTPAVFATCGSCHGANIHALATIDATLTDCTECHGSGAHGPTLTQSCIACHDVAIKHLGDNTGVRAITTEFGKWSHHVTGTTLQDAHCAACHLEGKVDAGAIVPDTTYHMADAATNLRNADTNADMPWNPASPNHTTMDNFCMSCHDGDGATGIAAIQAVMTPASGKTASASNPFADTISNQYDQLERPAVVDAAGQFASTNNSHHAVMAPKYTGRTRATIANAAAFTTNSSATLPGPRLTIFEAGKFNASYTPLGAAAVVADDSQLHCGDCHTVGQWKAGVTKNVDGTLNPVAIGAHGSNNEYMLRNTMGTDAKHIGTTFTSNKVTTYGPAAKPYLVCFNCHAFTTYGSTYWTASSQGHAGEYMTGADRCNGPYNTSSGQTGVNRIDSIISMEGATYGTANGNLFSNVFSMQCANCHNSGVSAANIFGGIHGSKQQTYTDGMGNTSKHFRFLPGLGNSMFVPGTKGGFTGGSLATYAMYSGNRDGSGFKNMTGQTWTQLPTRSIVTGTARTNATNTSPVGITRGSYQYTTGGASNDANWEQQTQQTVSREFDFQAKAMGCYTISPPGSTKSVVTTGGDGFGAAAPILAASDGQEAGLNGPNGTAEIFDNWGGCDDHNGAQGAGTGIIRKVLRPVSY